MVYSFLTCRAQHKSLYPYIMYVFWILYVSICSTCLNLRYEGYCALIWAVIRDIMCQIVSGVFSFGESVEDLTEKWRQEFQRIGMKGDMESWEINAFECPGVRTSYILVSRQTGSNTFCSILVPKMIQFNYTTSDCLNIMDGSTTKRLLCSNLTIEKVWSQSSPYGDSNWRVPIP